MALLGIGLTAVGIGLPVSIGLLSQPQPANSGLSMLLNPSTSASPLGSILSDIPSLIMMFMMMRMMD